MQQGNLTKAKNKIMSEILSKGVFQFRYYVCRNSAGTVEKHNENLKIAVEALHNKNKLSICGRRLFSKVFEDGSNITGINFTAINRGAT